VFGLSHVLYPFDCLNEALAAVGVDPGTVAPGTGISEQNRNKVAMLKGKCMESLNQALRLELTPGTKLVCAALKRMGCRLAVLTNTGLRAMAEHVKRELDIDFILWRDLEVVDGVFTGDYAGGELSDVSFRKMDLLKLMADREGINFCNVITVGDPLSGLDSSTARTFLDTFGPNVCFSTGKVKDLSIALYLMGFNGSDMRSMRMLQQTSQKRKWTDTSNGEPETVVEASVSEGKIFTIQASTGRSTPGRIKRLLEPLRQVRSGVDIATVRLSSLQPGGTCLGLSLQLLKGHPDQILKDLLLAAHRHGFEVRLEGSGVKELSPKHALSGVWHEHYENRYVITVVELPQIRAAALKALFGILAEHQVNVIRIDRLSKESMALTAMQLTVHVPSAVSQTDLSGKLAAAAQQYGVDIAFQQDDLDRWMRRLVVFDMDSTLIQQEVIDELAKIAGVEKDVKTITEAAMRGELNFFESLKTRVGLLKGHNAEELFAQVNANLIFTPGAKKLCATLKSMGFKMAVISGGFLPVAEEVQRHLGLDYAFANTLEVEEGTGLLTGKTSGPVVTPERKRALLATIANVEGCEIRQTIAVGDGSNDIPMLNAAGLGIAFCAKPKVQAATEFRINQKDLSTVLFLIGVSEQAAEELTSAMGTS